MTERDTEGIGEPSVTALLMRARNGDHGAFIALVTPLRAQIWGVCLHVAGNHHDAEDAFQESLIAAWQHLDRFRGEAKFGTWLHRVAANTAVSVMRRKKAHTTPVDFSDPAAQAANTEILRTPDFTDTVATRETVHAAIATLPQDFRTALVLREFGDLSVRDIALAQGVPESTVKTRLHRARKLLAEALNLALADS